MSERELTPDATQREQYQRGTVVRMLGQDWVLAHAVPPTGGAWDRLYDSGILEGDYEAEDVYWAAANLLARNYDLSSEEIRALILDADPRDFIPAIRRVIFGPDRPYVTYSEWVRASLWTLGANPETVDPSDIRLILEQGVRGGKILPEQDIVTCHWARERKDRRSPSNQVAVTNGADSN